ncbi:lipase 2 [Aspergillus indologenus CBS 114.80]|uniref:Lipase 2 n=1 Tax=Aspergillus indologenus CBS 114.80 TaxID=1450541 RepID=A0A2V5IAJ9_9EURO|nr:lipase 2 [Aspergillus indologenus CBS 114.80]
MRGLYTFGLASLAITAEAFNHPTAETRNGTYYGIHQSKWHQDYFFGIPYAQPPVDELRFRPPHSLNTSWTGERNATEMGPMCYGYGPTQMANGEHVSEDCLTLNVVGASNVSSSKGLLPVVVWGVQNGQGFVGVTLNYRLSYLGFLYGEEVAREGATNLGLRDQRLALQWVQENNAAFGGDPTKITIWGQEAGAFSVGLQLLAYGGRDDGLFRAAIAQSGSPMLMWPSVSATDWQPLYEAFLNATNCTDAVSGTTLDCLRRVPAATLSDVFSSDLTTFNRPNPVVDGDFIPKLGSSALEAGDFVKVPLLLGTTQDEGTWSYYGVEGINTTAEFPSKIAQLYPDDPAQGILSTLDDRPGNERAGRRMASQAWAKHGVDVYTNVYDVLFHAKWWQYGAQEQDDIAFLFHNVTLSESLSPTDQADQKKTFEPLSYLMTSMWVSFISTLHPNHISINGTKTWPKYSLVEPKALVFDVNATELCRVESDTYRSAAISHWMELFQTSEYPR